MEIPQVALRVSSTATGGSLVQITLTVTTPGLMASDHIPKASNARNVKVASQQKFRAGVKSKSQSPSKELIVP